MGAERVPIGTKQGGYEVFKIAEDTWRRGKRKVKQKLVKGARKKDFCLPGHRQRVRREKSEGN